MQFRLLLFFNLKPLTQHDVDAVPMTSTLPTVLVTTQHSDDGQICWTGTLRYLNVSLFRRVTPPERFSA